MPSSACPTTVTSSLSLHDALPISQERVEAVVRLRRLRFTAAEIAETLAMPLSTVSGILARLGMGRLGRLGLEQPVRYERRKPGELRSEEHTSELQSLTNLVCRLLLARPP